MNIGCRELCRWVVVLTMVVLAPFAIAHAETVNIMGTMQASVSDVFSIRFYTDANVLYSTNLPFTNIDPTRSMCYVDTRSAGDGKSDTGIMCESNLGVTWYLKMSVTTTSMPAFPLQNFKFYMDKPWSNLLQGPSNGSLGYPVGWNPVPTSASVIYASGQADENNAGFGTLATLSFAINPQGLSSGVNYRMSVTYTLTTSP